MYNLRLELPICCRNYIQLAQRIGCNFIDVQSDSLEVVSAFQCPLENMITRLMYLDECRTIMAGFASSQVSYCPWDANKASDCLAKSIENQDTRVWFDEPPLFLYPYLVDDGCNLT
jgi:hypothetical protein